MSLADRPSAALDVIFVLTPHFLLLDYAGPAEALRVAGEAGATVRLRAVAPTPATMSSLGVELGGLAPLPAQIADDQLVVVVGVRDSRLDLDRGEVRAVVDWLRAVVGRQRRVASVCSGALLLARAGLLDGRQCTTHHSRIELLRRCAPRAQVVENRLFVADGPVITSAGVTAGIDLALHLIESSCGAGLAARVARELVVYVRRAGVDPQLSPRLAHRNHLHPAVHRAQDAIAADPCRRWRVDELAAVAHVSPRHLSRLFSEHAGLGIAAYQQGLRLCRARELLADGGLSIERVAELAGFASARDFRRVRARHAAVPARYSQ